MDKTLFSFESAETLAKLSASEQKLMRRAGDALREGKINVLCDLTREIKEVCHTNGLFAAPLIALSEAMVKHGFSGIPVVMAHTALTHAPVATASRNKAARLMLMAGENSKAPLSPALYARTLRAAALYAPSVSVKGVSTPKAWARAVSRIKDQREQAAELVAAFEMSAEVGNVLFRRIVIDQAERLGREGVLYAAQPGSHTQTLAASFNPGIRTLEPRTGSV